MSNLKQVDVGFQCPETGMHIGLEVCLSTERTELAGASRALASGTWDRILLLCLTRQDLDRLCHILNQAPQPIDSRITLCMPCHLSEARSLRDVYDCPDLMYPPAKSRARASRNIVKERRQ